MLNRNQGIYRCPPLSVCATIMALILFGTVCFDFLSVSSDPVASASGYNSKRVEDSGGIMNSIPELPQNDAAQRQIELSSGAFSSINGSFYRNSVSVVEVPRTLSYPTVFRSGFYKIPLIFNESQSIYLLLKMLII